MNQRKRTRLPASVTALVAAALCLTAPQAVAASEGAVTASAVADCRDTCVLGVRAATHPRYDRFVIDLGAGKLPRWTTNLQKGGRLTMGEGAAMPVKGDEYLKITLHRATGFDFAGGTPVYRSPRHQTYDFPSLKGQGQFRYADASAREFHMGLALGKYSSYRLFALRAPNRVVVDVHH
ncbi:hypothetical protein [Streptomyces sp. MJP52]|uniref:AMIN-like domain-containing (lipo)protein n=1 Tax=Streptomyces sp. MJP52 TaxID=2940555 RepID=UPI0024766DCE|nr:hypothetical protein [Streptomyces sp. MJP52]MDH6224549.1 hypothetical protein [Streptomyces sp. MJP52]